VKALSLAGRVRVVVFVLLISSTFVVAFAFSFPMFLALRELKLTRKSWKHFRDIP
jgi:hypothetical protein